MVGFFAFGACICRLCPITVDSTRPELDSSYVAAIFLCGHRYGSSPCFVPTILIDITQCCWIERFVQLSAGLARIYALWNATSLVNVVSILFFVLGFSIDCIVYKSLMLLRCFAKLLNFVET